MEEILPREVEIGEQRLRAGSEVRLPGSNPTHLLCFLPVSSRSCCSSCLSFPTYKVGIIRAPSLLNCDDDRVSTRIILS